MDAQGVCIEPAGRSRSRSRQAHRTAPSYFSTAGTASRQLSFDAPAGDLVLKMKALDARGEELERYSRRLTVPAFDGSKLAIGSPMVLSHPDGTGSARHRRTEARATRGAPRIRSNGSPVHSLPCLRRPGDRSRWRGCSPSREGTSARCPPHRIKEGIYQLDVPLSVSLRDDYVIAIDATRGTESVRALVLSGCGEAKFSHSMVLRHPRSRCGTMKCKSGDLNKTHNFRKYASSAARSSGDVTVDRNARRRWSIIGGHRLARRDSPARA